MYLPEGSSTSYSSWGPGWWVEVSLRERELGRGGNDSVGLAWDKNQGQKPRLDSMLPEVRGRRDKRHAWGLGLELANSRASPAPLLFLRIRLRV